MSPDDRAAVVVIVICVGVLAAYRILCWLLDRHIRARCEDRKRWQQSTAPRTEADVRADLAAARKARDLVEQQDADLKFARIIAAEYPAGIPHQTRGTEEDQ